MSYRIEDLQSVIGSSGGMARSNLYRVQLPPVSGVNSRELNLLCKQVQLPGRTINATTRQIGVPIKQIVNGYAVGPISMSFHVLNDPKILSYFNRWMNKCIDNRTNEIGYYNDYAANKQIKIDLLKKGVAQKIREQNSRNRPVSNLIGSLIGNIGPLNFAQGSLDLGRLTDDSIAYRCTLLDAYPNAITPIQLGDNVTDLVEINISFIYKNWVQGDAYSVSSFLDNVKDNVFDRTIGRVVNRVNDKVDDLVDDAKDAVFDFLDDIF